MSNYIKKEDVLHKLSVIYNMARPDQRAVVTDAIREVCHMPVENVREEGDILKFFYCESEDDYYLGMRVDNFYYAKYNKESGQFCWCMSKYLPWGERVIDENTLWKEHTYPSEPVEIGFEKWLRGFIKKYVLDVKHGRWICEFYNDVFGVYQADCSVCKRESTDKYDKVSESYEYCPHCGARMDGDVDIEASREQWRDNVKAIQERNLFETKGKVLAVGLGGSFKDSLIKTEVDGLFLNFEQDGDTNG